jgi:hypothetical protein
VESSENFLVKYTTPTKYDQYPYGFIIKVIYSSHDHDYYVQTSQQQDQPRWTKIDEILTKTFKDYLEIPAFVEMCLNIIYDEEEQKQNNLNTLMEILVLYRKK